jgi:hypothetical protein
MHGPTCIFWAILTSSSPKALDRGDPTPGITAARVAKLDALGFVWSIGKGNRHHIGGW